MGVEPLGCLHCMFTLTLSPSEINPCLWTDGPGFKPKLQPQGGAPSVPCLCLSPKRRQVLSWRPSDKKNKHASDFVVTTQEGKRQKEKYAFLFFVVVVSLNSSACQHLFRDLVLQHWQWMKMDGVIVMSTSGLWIVLLWSLEIAFIVKSILRSASVHLHIWSVSSFCHIEK